MKRFMVFCRSIYYPSGGMKDFDNDFDDILKQFVMDKIFIMLIDINGYKYMI